MLIADPIRQYQILRQLQPDFPTRLQRQILWPRITMARNDESKNRSTQKTGNARSVPAGDSPYRRAGSCVYHIPECALWGPGCERVRDEGLYSLSIGQFDFAKNKPDSSASIGPSGLNRLDAAHQTATLRQALHDSCDNFITLL